MPGYVYICIYIHVPPFELLCEDLQCLSGLCALPDDQGLPHGRHGWVLRRLHGKHGVIQALQRLGKLDTTTNSTLSLRCLMQTLYTAHWSKIHWLQTCSTKYMYIHVLYAADPLYTKRSNFVVRTKSSLPHPPPPSTITPPLHHPYLIPLHHPQLHHHYLIHHYITTTSSTITSSLPHPPPPPPPPLRWTAYRGRRCTERRRGCYCCWGEGWGSYWHAAAAGGGGGRRRREEGAPPV